jgi:HAD superfamily hydrolase (TIGR01509 family)
MGFRLLCLDAGFTLLAPRHSMADALAGVLAEDGHAITEDDLQAAWEASDRWFWDEYHRPGNDTWSDDARITDYWRRYNSVLLQQLKVRDHAAVLERVLASQFASDAWELYPDAEPMLRAVREMGVPIGIISDWGSNLRDIATEVGLDRYVEFILPSGAVGVAKPNPSFFAMALERAGVAPHEGLMVGDSYRADVRGAWAAGMDAVWLDRTEGVNITPDDEPPPTDVRVIRSLAELPEIVRRGGPLPRGAEFAPAAADQPARA